jgi:hypothetical protein
LGYNGPIWLIISHTSAIAHRSYFEISKNLQNIAIFEQNLVFLVFNGDFGSKSTKYHSKWFLVLLYLLNMVFIDF